MSSTAILIRNNTHELATTRYALKAEQVAISIVKTPIQIPIPRNSPALIDIGIFRPSITISGLVDEQGGNLGGNSNAFSTDEIAAGVAGMTKFGFTRGGTVDSENYYIPYKNKLEEAAYNWLAQDSTPLELELGNAKYPVYNEDVEGDNADTDPGTAHTTYNSAYDATGGAIYQVAIQQFRVEMAAAKEDRWQYTFQFVTKARSGVTFA